MNSQGNKADGEQLKPIGAMLNFARLGGTMLNRCLAAMPDVVMLSEVNPLGGGWWDARENSLVTPASQARGWYKLDLDDSSFKQEVHFIYDCLQYGHASINNYSNIMQKNACNKTK